MNGGVILSFPFILFHVVRFISPGLSGQEKKYLYLLIPGALTAFFLGGMFGYLIGAFFFRNPDVTPPPSVLFYTGTKTFRLTANTTGNTTGSSASTRISRTG